MTALEAITPIDGRYQAKVQELSSYFSEFALIKYRVMVEVKYFQALFSQGLPQLAEIDPPIIESLNVVYTHFSLADAEKIKITERQTNHDVKAVEYFVKDAFKAKGLGKYLEFVHFGLTSQDINNTAVPLSLKEAFEDVFMPVFKTILADLQSRSKEWATIPMLARTHGQPASPTLLGKEMGVFISRLKKQLAQLQAVELSAKFGGATGNMNAHYTAYPGIEWHEFATNFVENDLGLSRSYPSTQIDHYDNLAAFFHAMLRINTILIDLCRDIWTYISMEYFKQKTIAGEIGSSAMPHKVNPIDFENAEGNLGMANAILEHLARKLPISRLQRDLTDSTVLRNIGVPFAHTLIAFKSIRKGLNKLLLNEPQLYADLDNNWIVIAEAIQNILRREGFDKPYEALKELTRGKNVGEQEIKAFIEKLKVADNVKKELLALSPHMYTGKW